MTSNTGNIIMAAGVAVAALLALSVLMILAWWCHAAGQWCSLPMEAMLVYFCWRFAGYAVSGGLSAWDFLTAKEEL